MLNRTLALLCMSIGLYGGYVGLVNVRAGYFNIDTVFENKNGQDRLLVAQDDPNNVSPHRGSGRCDKTC